MIAMLCITFMVAAYGTTKSGVGVASMGVMRPKLVVKSILPVLMTGVLGIYGLIITPKAKSYYMFDGYAHFSSGLACGLVGLSTCHSPRPHPGSGSREPAKWYRCLLITQRKIFHQIRR
ncbi:putative V-ATPase proteolipid subunit [Helianthus annuus]|nr:putative V-ATPase proteolipid subunit [Helianthus annuus]